MNLRRRIERLERSLRPSGPDREAVLRRTVDYLVMMDLSVSGLRPDDPDDTIATRWHWRVKAMGLHDDGTSAERIAGIHEWYSEGVASDWVDRSPV